MARPVSPGGRSPFTRKVGSPFGGNRPIKGGKGGKGILGLAGDATKAGTKALLNMAQAYAGMQPADNSVLTKVPRNRIRTTVNESVSAVSPLDPRLVYAAIQGDKNAQAVLAAGGVLPLVGQRGNLLARAALTRRLMAAGDDMIRVGGGELGVNRVLGAAKKAGNLVEAPAGARSMEDRFTFLIPPDGSRVIFGPRGWHHAQTARGAGITNIKGYTQGELFLPNDEFEIPARMFVTNPANNAQGAGFTRRQAAALAGFMQNARGTQFITPDQAARFDR